MWMWKQTHAKLGPLLQLSLKAHDLFWKWVQSLLTHDPKNNVIGQKNLNNFFLN
jgi:hypothetical protein